MDFFVEEGVALEVINPKRKIDAANVQAVSCLNTCYRNYKKFVSYETHFADSVYNLREKYRGDGKKDSMRALIPTLLKADSLLLSRNLEYTKTFENNRCNELIKAYIIFRRLMLYFPVSDISLLFNSLGENARQSLYGRAVSNYLWHTHY